MLKCRRILRNAGECVEAHLTVVDSASHIDVQAVCSRDRARARDSTTRGINPMWGLRSDKGEDRPTLLSHFRTGQKQKRQEDGAFPKEVGMTVGASLGETGRYRGLGHGEAVVEVLAATRVTRDLIPARAQAYSLTLCNDFKPVSTTYTN